MPGREPRDRGRAEIHCDRDAPVPDSGGRGTVPPESANAREGLPGDWSASRPASQLDFSGVLAGIEPIAATAARLTAVRELELSGSSSFRASAGSRLATSC